MSFTNAQSHSSYADMSGACCAVRSSFENNMIHLIAGIVCAMSVLFIFGAMMLRLRLVLVLSLIILAIIIMLRVLLVLPVPGRRKR